MPGTGGSEASSSLEQQPALIAFAFNGFEAPTVRFSDLPPGLLHTRPDAQKLAPSSHLTACAFREGTPVLVAPVLREDRVMEKMNVESFNLDHRAVAAPYVRIADRKVLPGGDTLIKYDIRFTQPNTAHLEMPTVHSIEHLSAEHMRNHTDRLIDFSPMGCQTGFYALTLGLEPEEFFPILEATLNDILNATEVPAANEVQCGWGANHTLEGAQAAAREFLAARDEWAQVMA